MITLHPNVFRTALPIILLVALHAAARAGEMTAEKHQAELTKLMATMDQTIARGPYAPTAESLNKYAAPDWYADAKLGIDYYPGSLRALVEFWIDQALED